MSRIAEFRLLPYRLRLRAPHRDARGEYRSRTGALLVLVDTDGIEGIGDCAPLGPWSPPLHVCLVSLEALARKLRGAELHAALRVASAAATDQTIPGPVRAALEAAVGFLIAARRRVPLSSLLAPSNSRPDSLQVNGIVDAFDHEEAVKQALGLVAEGYRCLKVKAGRDADSDVARLLRLRAVLGAGVALRVDANGAWSPETLVGRAAELRKAGVDLVEQPVATELAADPVLLQRLREQSGLRIALDESLAEEHVALRLVERGACDAVVLKPSLLGLGSAGRIAQAARAAGMEVIVTGAYETGVGFAAVVEFAAAYGSTTSQHGLSTALDVLGDRVEGVVKPAAGAIQLPHGGVFPILASRFEEMVP